MNVGQEEWGISSLLILKGIFFAILFGAAWLAHEPLLRPWFVGCMLAATFIQAILYRYASWSVIEVMLGALLIRAAFFPLPPIFSDDVYRYIWDGWLILEGINPYLETPVALAGLVERPPVDSAVLNSPEFYSIYPPLSQFLFAGGYALSTWLPADFAVKLIFSGAEFFGLFVLARLVAPRRLMLYAWFPLIVFASAGQAHTEGALVFLLFATIWSLRKKRPLLASVFLTLATWVKLYPVLFLPWLIYRYGWRTLVAFVGLSVLVWWPFLQVEVIANYWESLSLYGSYFEFNAGLYYLISWIAETLGVNDATAVVGWILAAIALPVVLLIYRRALPSWSFERTAFWLMGAYLLFSTTIHPWYFVGLIAMVPFMDRIPLHWLWIVALSIGTYLWYTHEIYASFVWAAWLGGGLIYLWIQPDLKQGLLKYRARWKADYIRRHLDRGRVLDAGCGEGYVGALLAEKEGVSVMLADLEDCNRTDLPHRLLSEKRWPFSNGQFDATVLSFVLHHTENPAQVLSEALRVTAGSIIILENPVESVLQKTIVQGADRLVNTYRGGKGASQHVEMRSREAWRALFQECGARLEVEEELAGGFASTVLFKLRRGQNGEVPSQD